MLRLTDRAIRIVDPIEIGLAQAVVKDLPELYEVEGISPAQVRTVQADWLDRLADFLRDPWTSVVLVMVGITCLILELKMPGVGLPGVDGLLAGHVVRRAEAVRADGELGALHVLGEAEIGQLGHAFRRDRPRQSARQLLDVHARSLAFLEPGKEDALAVRKPARPRVGLHRVPRERARLARGMLEIRSRPGQGTTVKFDVPLEARPA